jgi:hypothetical protein
MTEEIKQDVAEETPQQDVVDQQEQVEVPSQPIKEESKKDADFNWEQARQVLHLQKKEIEELKAKVAQNVPQEPQQEEKDEFSDLDPEDFLTVAKARDMASKLAAKEAAKAAKQIVHEYMQQQAVATDETRARSKYEDFDYVIENFAIPMIKNDPALAYKIQNSKNPAEIAYKLAKVSDEYEAQNMKQSQPNPKAEKILKNTQRPVSSSAASAPLKTQADNYSSMTKEQIWAESQKYARVQSN